MKRGCLSIARDLRTNGTPTGQQPTAVRLQSSAVEQFFEALAKAKNTINLILQHSEGQRAEAIPGWFTEICMTAEEKERQRLHLNTPEESARGAARRVARNPRVGIGVPVR